MATQNVIINVYDYGTTTDINFNYRIYQRDPAKSYRPGEKQYIPEDLGLWPNSPPVDSGHILVSSGTDISSPHTVVLNEKDGYYIVMDKEGYITLERRFYIADSTDYNADGNLVGPFPGNMYFELSRTINDNARIFV